MNIETVNELIQSLESAGELSIREQKFLKLAKEFRICSASLDAAIKTGNMLAAQNAQLAAENMSIKAMNDCLSEELRGYESDGAFEGPKMHLLWWQVETPATDRIVAGIKADEAKFIFHSILDNPAVTGLGSLVDWLEQHANDSDAVVQAVREGADK